MPSIITQSEAITFSPNDTERQLAIESSRALIGLTAMAANKQPPSLQLKVEDKSIALPPSLLNFMLELLTEAAKGNVVTLVPGHAEYTTQQAADYLNVSRPYLVKLIEAGKIPHRKVGTHRRILFEHLQDYKQIEDARRAAALDELAQQAQQQTHGY